MNIEPIEDVHIRQALERMRQGRSPDGSPLLELRAVRGRLAPGRPPTPASLECALYSLVCEVISTRWLGLRQELGLPAPGPGRMAGGPARLREDFARGSAELEAWSCLVHRYASARALRVQEIARLVGAGTPHDRRLISRRIALGRRLLARALVGLEAAAAPVPPPRRYRLRLRRAAAEHTSM